MRWFPPVVIVLLLLGSCFPKRSETSSGAGGAGGTGGADGGDTVRECDGKKDCSACAMCAVNSACTQLFNSCQQSSVCFGLDQCIGLCGFDAECKQYCYAYNSEGVDLYDALTNCVYCQECLSDCAGFRSCK